MRLNYKFSIAVLVVIMLFGVTSYISFTNIEKMQDSFKLLNEYHKPVIDSLKDMDLGALRVVSSTLEYAYIMHTSSGANPGNNSLEEQLLSETTHIFEGKDSFNNAFEKYDVLTKKSTAKEREYVPAIRGKWAVFVNRSDEFLKIQKNSASDESLIEAKERFEAAEKGLFEAINAAIEFENNETRETEEIMGETVNMAVSSTLIAFVVLAAIALFSLAVLSRSITKPIERLRLEALEIGKGNLDAKIDVSSKDELGDLAGAFNKMTEYLKRSRGELLIKSRDLGESKIALESRVKELTEAKLAMLNMMEDAENANKELVAAQSQLTENVKELSDANVKKNQFMSIAAHELKTPMTSIHGFSQLLQNPAIANDAKKRNKYLAIMDHETKRLARLVTDVLDISRIDLNAVTFDIASVNLRDVLDSVKTEMNVQIKQKGLKSEYIIGKNLPEISTDKERLTQILMNLITNSIKYTPKGKITVSALKEGEGAHFIVKDTGIGISKQNQPKIFTRFYQVNSSYTRRAGGVGLGLSLCKEFVARLGGKIWFTSVAGKGSEFHFTLPKSPQGAEKSI